MTRPTRDTRIEAVYGLTPLQHGMLFHALDTAGPQAYVEALTITLHGPLDEAALRHAWERTIARHPALRTAFLWQRRDRPAQVVARAVQAPWRLADVSAFDPEGRARELRALVDAERGRGFDLARPPLLRAVLVRLSPDEHAFVWVYHHLLLDGWSVPIVLGDVMAEYALARGKAIARPVPPRPFGDYVSWLERQDARRLEHFWRDALAGVTEPTSIPPDRTGQRTAQWRESTVTVEARVSAAIGQAARGHGVTPATMAQAAWAAVLSRWTGRRDVVVGLTVSGRPDALAGADRMVGMFINTLPLRVPVDASMSIPDWLRDVQRRQAALRDHEQAALVDVQRWSGLSRAPGAFDHILVFENYPASDAPEALLDGLRIGDVRGLERSNYPLSIVIGPGAAWSVKFIYDEARYDAGTIDALAAQFVDQLARLAGEEDATVGSLLAPSMTEEAALRVAAGRPRASATPSVLPLVMRHVAERPHAVAVYGPDGPDGQLTYAQLDARATALARALVSRGVTSGTAVGVQLPRGPSLIVALLAIWKAGGLYVPIEASYPAARVAWMLEDCAARFVITERGDESLPAGASAVAVTATGAAAVLPAPPHGDQLAYVLYTSGSTGMPKGIAVPHKAIVRLVESPCFASLGPDARVAQAGPVAFDASTFEIWGALAHGGSVVVVPRDALLDPLALVAFLQSARVTTAFLTTALFNRVADEAPAGLASLDDLLFGGESADPVRVRRVLEAGAPRRLTNAYGPTETTTFATSHRIDAVSDGARTVPIGQPIQDTSVWVIDEQLGLVPPGAPGELCIGGPGLAAGYFRRPDLTAERFIANPFGPEGRLYRTGDRVRWNAAGALEFLGRVDDQVKIRGHRIEPGEIAAVLRQAPRVADALIVARETPAGRELVAYASGAGLSSGALRDWLRDRLPAYMVPAAIVTVGAWPLTAHGKIDRAALPQPEDAPAVPVSAGWTPSEEIVAGVWRDVLGRHPEARDADFFDGGGHSLLATQVATRLRDAFGVDIPLRLIFDVPALDALAREIDARLRSAHALPALASATNERPDPLPLSFAQQRLWFLEQMAPPTPAYYIASALRLAGRLDVAALERSLGDVLARHEALRTAFPSAGGTPVQQIAPPSPVTLPLEDLSGHAGDREALTIEAVSRAADEPFDLAAGPLYRFRLLRLAADEHVLVIVLHHIIADGWSMTILSRELSALYRGYTDAMPPALPALRVQYADVAVWQRKCLQGEALQTQVDYWKRQLADVTTLRLPTDRPRPPRQTFDGKARPVRIPAAVVDALSEIGRRQGATLFMTLLAAYQAMLARYSHDTDIAVGTPVANRTSVEAEALIGFFVNMLVIRTDAGGDPPFEELVRRVRQTALDAYTHQDVPFEMLVELLRPERDPGRQPLFQVHFALHNMPSAPVELPGLRLEPITGDVRWVRFDLECHLWRTAEGVEGFWAWNTNLFDDETIARLDGHFRTLLAAVATDPSQRVSALPLATPDEQRLIIDRGNETARPAVSETAVARFERVAAGHADAIAVTCNGEHLAYAELNARANRLARRLERAGAAPERLVGIYLDRSADLVVAILAVLKAGAAYLPIDIAYPQERVAHMLADSDVRIVLTSGARAGGLPAFDGQTIRMDAEVLDDEAASDASRPVGASHAAYVIYTSGSTGQPKGSVITHGNLLRLFESTEPWFAFGPEDVWALFHSPAFDFSVWEIWGALLYGGRVVVVPHDVSRSPADFVSLVEAEGVTVLNQTPLAFYQFMRAEAARPSAAGLALRYVIFGGDALDLPRLLPWFDRHGDARPRLINMYGITETTVHVTYQPIDRARVERGWGSVIGQPIPDLRTYVLDSDLGLVPTGVAGEMYVGGAGVARGYLRRPALTAWRFVPDPFSRESGARLYRTGDAARCRANGDLEYLGRLDTQIKIRGFRVELGEIEAALRAHPAVQDAVVAVRDTGDDDRRLAAYVTLRAFPPATGPGAAPREVDAHVRDWQTLYDSVYAGAAPDADTDFDITGWNSSLTRQPFPPDEMRAWRDETVARVRALSPRRVLEIGCGTGLLLLPLAPATEQYVGLDISGEVLARLGQRVERRGLRQVQLHQRFAHETADLAAASFDAVIINSVVQYFPSIDYLIGVIAEAIRLVRPGGHVFLGDLRNLTLAEAFWTAVETARAGGPVPPAALARRLEASRREEEELLVDPALFAALRSREPRLQGVEVLLKRCSADNELSRYRYDVLLHVEREPEAVASTVLDGATVALSDVERAIETHAGTAVIVRNLRNARLTEGEGVEPAEWWDVAERLGSTVAVSWSPEREDLYDVAFGGAHAAPGALLPIAVTPEHPRPWDAYGNDPLRARQVRGLIPEIRRSLETRLPAYMVPASITVVESIPLTAHGKIDRRALPEPDGPLPGADPAAMAPRTPTESALAAIWSDVLALPSVGMRDSFFDLGGHSLLATQLIARISDHFDADVPIRLIFDDPTIEAVGRFIDALPAHARRAPATIAAPRPLAADHVSGMSDEDVEAALRQLENEEHR